MHNRSHPVTLPRRLWFALGLGAAFLVAGCQTTDPSAGWRPLFTEEGVPRGWLVRHWADVRNPAPADAQWRVSGGVLSNTGTRGTWLISEAEYGEIGRASCRERV